MTTHAAVIETEERIQTVKIEGLALLKIVKHCHESLPQMVTGSLLGLAVGDGVLEITHSFPFPEPLRSGDLKDDDHAAAAQPPQQAAAAAATGGEDEDGMMAGAGGAAAAGGSGGLEGYEFQLEMMRMLREVNVDNNCVGWYQSMYLGSYSTSSFLENQLSYQTDLSPNAVVILYDPMQTSHGNLVIKCFRLTDACVKLQASGKNAFLDPNQIFEDIPVQLVNPGLVRLWLSRVVGGGGNDGPEGILAPSIPTADTTFDRLDLSTNPYLEKHLEFLCSWVDDLAAEQQKFQFYARNISRRTDRRKREEDGSNNQSKWLSSDAPKRMESLLITHQIRSYCDQMDKFAEGGFSKLFLAGGLHQNKEPETSGPSH
mmetsp:Transcript_16459/g.37778  ORF Transcript_16459/g.37778 Transcript_16459/m.37778 type:complete len:372 (-) Transcript_16459:545-1660(-)